MKETFGEYIRKIRTEKELTLTQLAAKLDMDSANLSKVENGKRSFDEKRLTKLADFLELDINKLKPEFYSDIIAKKFYKTSFYQETLSLAEQKIIYLRQKEAKQGTIKF